MNLIVLDLVREDMDIDQSWKFGRERGPRHKLLRLEASAEASSGKTRRKPMETRRFAESHRPNPEGPAYGSAAVDHVLEQEKR